MTNNNNTLTKAEAMFLQVILAAHIAKSLSTIVNTDKAPAPASVYMAAELIRKLASAHGITSSDFDSIKSNKAGPVALRKDVH